MGVEGEAGIEHGEDFGEALEASQKRQKMGTGHTKFEKLMMSHIRANLPFLVHGKVLVTRT